MLTNIFKFCLRTTLNGLITFLDRILPPLESTPPLLRSAEPEPEPTPQEPIYVGNYPIGSHAEMFITPEQPPILSVVEEPEPITEVVITLPPAPNDALEAIAEVLTLAPGRAQIVEALLDEAWLQGITTYSALIAYVKDKSGQGTSKKTISEWKKSRRLGETPEAIAA